VALRVKTISSALLALRKRATSLAPGLEGVSGELAHAMHATVHVGIAGLVGMAHGLDYLPGLLRAGRGVQIDQGVPKDLLR